MTLLYLKSLSLATYIPTTPVKSNRVSSDRSNGPFSSLTAAQIHRRTCVSGVYRRHVQRNDDGRRSLRRDVIRVDISNESGDQRSRERNIRRRARILEGDGEEPKDVRRQHVQPKRLRGTIRDDRDHVPAAVGYE